MNNCQYCGKECKGKFCDHACANKYWNPLTKESRRKEIPKRDEIITLDLICVKCRNGFSLTRARKKLTGKNIPKYCSTKCSHSREVSEETRLKISNGVNAFNATLHTKEKKLRYKIDEKGSRINHPRIRVRYLSKNNCIVCGNNIERHSEKYCSQECNNKDKLINKLNSVLLGECTKHSTIKKYLIFIKGHQCSICKNTEWMNEPIPLVMDHIDGRSNNNAIENLRLVCGNCDMKLPTYKSKNKNSDRINRKKYYLTKKDLNPLED